MILKKKTEDNRLDCKGIFIIKQKFSGVAEDLCASKEQIDNLLLQEMTCKCNPKCVTKINFMAVRWNRAMGSG